MSFKLTDFITVSNTGITTFGSDGILINRTGADAYLFFQNSGTNRGAIYGGDLSGNAGLRFYVGNNSDPSIVLDSNGQVGIGSTPGGAFDVSYDAAALNAPRLTDTRSFAINNGAGLDFMGKVNSIGNTSRFGSIYGKKENATDGNTDGYLEFQTNNVARLTISSTGAASFSSNSNSSIINLFQNSDTTDASTRNTIELVAGNRFLQLQAYNADHVYFNRSSGANLYFQEAGSTQLQIDTGGNAIFSGDVSVFPKQIIASYASSDSGTAANPSYAFYANETMGMYPAGTNTLGFSTDGTNRLTISPAGNVGIGSSPIASPNSADTSLSVYAAQDSSIILGDSVETWEIYQNDDLFFSYGSSPTTVLTLKRTTGNVGIGITTPEELLEIKASSAPAIQLNQGDTYKGIIRLGGNDLEIRGSGGLMEFYNGSDDGDSSTLRLSITNKGAIGQAVTPITDPYVAGSEQWMTYQIGKNGIMGAYKNNNESMFGINTYVDAAGVSKAITSGTNGTAVRFFADSITFNQLTSSGTSQTQSTRLTISSTGLATFTPGGEFAALFENTNTTGGQHCYVDIKSNGGSNGLAILRFITDVAESGGTSAIIGSQDDLIFQTGTGDTLSTQLTITSSGLANFSQDVYLRSSLITTDGTTANYRWQTYNDANNDAYTINSRNQGDVLTIGYLTGTVTAPIGNLFCSNGNIIGGSATDLTGTHYFNKGASVAGGILYAGSSTTGRFSLVVQASDSAYNNSPDTCLKVGATSSTSRSVSAAGTFNASGADYAEYMIKSTTDPINKGDIVGVNSDGLLTNIFNDAISFVIKSTDPSFVGNDTWGIESEDKNEIEEARIKVDRVAFSGQVPCNVTGASVGDYIIPVASSDGKITGEAISNPTFEQYKISVGKVWKIMEDGRSWVAVKIG